MCIQAKQWHASPSLRRLLLTRNFHQASSSSSWQPGDKFWPNYLFLLAKSCLMYSPPTPPSLPLPRSRPSITSPSDTPPPTPPTLSLPSPRSRPPFLFTPLFLVPLPPLLLSLSLCSSFFLPSPTSSVLTVLSGSGCCEPKINANIATKICFSCETNFDSLQLWGTKRRLLYVKRRNFTS